MILPYDANLGRMEFSERTPMHRLGLWRKFDRRTEEHIPEAGLQLVETRFVVDDLIKMISARPIRNFRDYGPEATSIPMG